MKKTVTLLASLLIALTAGAQTINVHMTDGTVVNYPLANVNYIDFTASATPDPKPDNTPEGVVAVDLGLPSGTKWANMNVGAKKVEDYGLYFAWGETVGYTSDTSDGHVFDWASYKWCNGSETTLTKYCTEDSYGTVDNKTVLDLEDDAAYMNWGSAWRMPTKAEVEELLNNTTSTWTTVNGVKGRRFTSKTNGNSIFLPAAGLRLGLSFGPAGSRGYYWSSSLYESIPSSAYYLRIFSGYAFWYGGGRLDGLSVRPVRQN